jgi:hypothetical protein
MTISTYTELQTAIENWSARPDLDSIIPDFIAIAEAEFNRRLRTIYQETRATVSITSYVGTLPTDFLSAKSVSDQYGEMDYLPAHQFTTEEDSGNTKRVYTLAANQIRSLSDDTTLTVLYWAKVPALASNSTNWLLTNFPDLYLYRSLQELCGYTMDAAGEQKWGALADRAYQQVNTLDRGEGVRLQVRAA